MAIRKSCIKKARARNNSTSVRETSPGLRRTVFRFFLQEADQAGKGNRTGIITAVILAVLVSFTQTQETSAPQLINYQGRLTDNNGKGLTGSKRLTFNIYDGSDSGANL